MRLAEPGCGNDSPTHQGLLCIFDASLIVVGQGARCEIDQFRQRQSRTCQGLAGVIVLEELTVSRACNCLRTTHIPMCLEHAAREALDLVPVHEAARCIRTLLKRSSRLLARLLHVAEALSLLLELRVLQLPRTGGVLLIQHRHRKQTVVLNDLAVRQDRLLLQVKELVRPR